MTGETHKSAERRWSAPPVERRRDLDTEEFLDEYVAKSRPVVVPGAVTSWSAIDKWTPEWFGANYGDLRIAGDDGPTLAEVVEAIDDKSLDSSYYARNLNLSSLDARLLADVQPMPETVTIDNWLQSRLLPALPTERFGGELFIAPVEMRYPYLHWDGSHVHANFFMIHGTKEIAIFNPDQTSYLYPVPGATNVNHRSALDDVYDPDLERFPLFDQAVGTLVIIEPGDHLFVPGGWWHTVRSATPSISIVVKHANASNWHHIEKEFPQRFRKWSPARHLSAAYLRVVGAWLARGS
ncbi:MAG: cupin-like domain-containing protein [Acidimicrobiales bacterium]